MLRGGDSSEQKEVGAKFDVLDNLGQTFHGTTALCWKRKVDDL